MIYKLLLTISTALTLVSSAAMADGLSLSSSGITDSIKVTCNGTTLSQEMKPNSNISNIPWLAVNIAFGSQTLNCTFNLDNANKDRVGSATLLLSTFDTQAEATNVQYDPHYLVVISPTNTYASSISVAIKKAA